jgi:Domain of unknown function (DUF4375)
MSERIPCTTCGASILHATAERTGGLCKPCKGGYRDSIERGKIWDQFSKTAEYRHWSWLVTETHNSEEGFQKLSHPNKLFFAVNLVSGDVQRGGFYLYFTCDAADYYNFAVEGLLAMDAKEALRLLTAAKQLLFGEAAIPKTDVERWNVLQSLDAETQERQGIELDLLDDVFYKDIDRLGERMLLFAQEHNLYKTF